MYRHYNNLIYYLMPIASKTINQERVIDIPVLPHVAAVMRRLYGGGVIPANHNTLRGKAIANCFVEIPDEFSFPDQVFRYEKIQIALNYRIARYYQRWNMHAAFELGSYYEKVVQRMMFCHIVAQVRCGKTINFAINDFYDLYGITEDDYARESALMMYHTYKKKMHF